MTYSLLDEFCGAGGLTQGAAAVPGVQPKAAANHDPLSIASHQANFPDVYHITDDVRHIDYAEFPRCDLAHFSPICFPAGTLILTLRGLIPIEDVKPGDFAFTHERRWKPVIVASSRTAPTVMVYANGLATGIETTLEHPFYTRLRVREWRNDIRRWRYQYGDPGWTEAGDLRRTLQETHAVATPADFGDPLPIPDVPGRGMAFSEDFWWLIGRWLGDGMLRIEQAPPREGPKPREQHAPRTQPAGSTCVMCPNPARPVKNASDGRVSPYCSDKCMRDNQPSLHGPTTSRHEISIVCGHHEADDLATRLAEIAPARGPRAGHGELRWQRKANRTATVFTASHQGLAPWIAEHFGRYSAGKTIPAWALTMPSEWRRALLDGYLSADGSFGHTTGLTSVSKRLAFGMRMLATSLGHSANIKGPFTRQPRTIEGRPVTERPSWAVSWITAGPAAAHSVTIDGYRWQPVRRVVPTGRTAEVFNISVADDESYLADGITVHNCPPFTDARGQKQYFDADTQTVLWETEDVARLKAETRRGRVLMFEVIRYLEVMSLRGQPVLAGTVENVVQAVKWDRFQGWLKRIQDIPPGYETRVLAVNSAHLHPVTMPRPPQSRDRLLVMYWRKDIGRAPDTDKWLTRPWAWCPSCDQWVRAIQVFKKPGAFMGRYGVRHGQYVYRCPHRTCRERAIEPDARPAIDIIDWALPAQVIGERVDAKGRPDPLEESTLSRIRAGIARHYAAMLTPAGGTWRDSAVPLTVPMPARTTRETDGLVTTPEWDRQLAFIMRNNSSRGSGAEHCTPVTEPVRTLTTAGHQSLVLWDLLVPYYTTGAAFPPGSQPMGALSTRDRYGLAIGDAPPADVLRSRFRMLGPHEIGGGMGFTPQYIVLGPVKAQVRQYGQAITPALGECAYYAHVEMLSGQEFDPAPWAAPPPLHRAGEAPAELLGPGGQESLFEMPAAW